MTEHIPQSTSKLVMFKAYLSSDHVTEATGKTIAITISKNGGAFGNPNAGATNATEISSGWYKVTLDTTDTGTLGPIAVRGAVATIDDVGILLEVVSATTGGMTNLDAAVSTRASQTGVDDLPTNAELATAFGTADDAVLAAIAALNDLSQADVRTAVGLATANLDTQLTDLPTNAELATALASADDAVLAVIGDIPTNAELATALGTADDAVLAQIALVKAQTDLIPASPAATGDIPTAIENADALLDRNMATGTDSGSTTVRTPRQALRFLRNKWSISGTTLTVAKENDTTASWTAAITQTPGADPITASDPAGP